MLVLHLVWENISLLYTSVHDSRSSPWSSESSCVSSSHLTMKQWNSGCALSQLTFTWVLVIQIWDLMIVRWGFYTLRHLPCLLTFSVVILRHYVKDMNSWLNCYLGTTTDMEGQWTKQEIQTSVSNPDSLASDPIHIKGICLCLGVYCSPPIPGHVNLEHHSWKTAKKINNDKYENRKKNKGMCLKEISKYSPAVI